MRAITEMPANTPRPIGRTDSFFPGSVKAACEEALAAAAEASEAESAADVAAVVEEPLKELDVVLAEEGEEDDVGDGATAGPLDTPYKTKMLENWTCKVCKQIWQHARCGKMIKIKQDAHIDYNGWICTGRWTRSGSRRGGGGCTAAITAAGRARESGSHRREGSSGG
jgi:hypothetical protein